MQFNMSMTARTVAHNIVIGFFFTLAATTPVFAQVIPGADPVLRALQSSSFPAHPGADACFERPTAEAGFCPDNAEIPLNVPLSPDTLSGTSNDRAGAPTLAPESAKDRWPWRRAGIVEYTGVTVAAAGTIYFEEENGRPGHPIWTQRNDFDEAVRRALRISDRSARDACSTASDALMGLMIAAPILDSFATLGLRDGRWDYLWQTSMINMESFTFTSLVSSLMQNLLARERPFVRDCVNGNCEFGLPNRSMPSGHAAFAFTGAGLICTHHDYQSLYGNPGADDAVCISALGAASVTGILRIVSDTHYTTDVLAGTAIGLFSGFVLPRVLHYYWSSGTDAKKKKDAHGTMKQLIVSPLPLSGGGGLACHLWF